MLRKLSVLVVLLGLVVFILPVYAAPPGLDVNVTNTPDVNVANTPNVNVTNTPLPVQGNVNVSGAVNVANTPNVNVTNTPLPVQGTVNIGNEPLSVTVENGDNGSVVRIPFQYDASVNNWTGRVNFPISLTDFDFQTSDRLVIEHISAHLIITPTSMLQSFTVDTGAGMTATHYLSVPQSISTDSNGNAIYTVSQPLRLYTDGGYGVLISLIKNPPSCGGFPDQCYAAIAVSGYIIPGDSASLAP